MLIEMIEQMSEENRKEAYAAIKTLATADFIYDEDANDLYDPSWDDNFNYYTGATKVCIVVGRLVFKTSYTGFVEVWGDEKKGIEDKIIHYDEESVDYADVEYKVYQHAITWGVDKFFAPIESLGNGVYVQARVERWFDMCRRFTPTSIKENPEIQATIDIIKEYDLYPIPEGLTHACLINKLATLDELKKLATFIDSFDINDLHDGNLGWYDGHPVIFDYCGYDSSTSRQV